MPKWRKGFPEEVRGGAAKELLMVLRGIDRGDPESIRRKPELKAIKEVSFFSIGLREVPNSIECLTQLTLLNLAGNKLTRLPETIGGLSQLTELYVSNNQLTALPETIGELSQLTWLAVSHNQLIALPETIGRLSRLTKLLVCHNQLTTLPETIGGLSMLDTLDVSYNQLTKIPDCLQQIASLQNIKLKRLQLSLIPYWLFQRNLPFVFDDVSHFWNEPGIYLCGTTLSQIPISLFEQRDHALIEQWYKAHDQSPESMVATNEAKVIFLGDGEVGKTYTIRRLLKDGLLETEENKAFFHTEITHGIIIKEQDTVTSDDRPIKLHYWDFGGQTIMHSMHRVFLTEDTVYVILLSGRKDGIQMARARYWLRMVESFAAKAPILLLVNLCDHTGYHLAPNTLKKEFPNLNITIHSVDAKKDSPEKILELRGMISDLASTLQCYTQLVPRKWENIRREVIRQHKENGLFCLPQEEYHSICRQFGLENTSGELYEALLARFNILGDCFSYYRDEEKKVILGYKVLNPEWLTNAIYLILEKGKHIAKDKHGILTAAEIQGILRHPEEGESGDAVFMAGVKYDAEKCGYVLEIMRQHKLSYLMENGDEFIPALCPEDGPDTLIPARWDSGNSDHGHIQYALEYTYLPDTVIHQLMVCCRKEHMALDKCWSRGMWIDYSLLGLTAVVDASGENNVLKIDLYAYGDTRPWKLLSPLREAIREIDGPMGLASPTDNIITPFGSVSVEALLNSRANGYTEYPVGINGDYHDIDELLGDSIDPKAIERVMQEIQRDSRKGRRYSEQITKLSASNSNVSILVDRLVIQAAKEVVVEQAETVTLNCDFQQLFKTMDQHLDLVTDDLLCAIGDLMYDNMDVAVRRIGGQLRDTATPKEKRIKNARTFAGDAATFATLGTALKEAWPAISTAVSTHGQGLFTLLQKLFS